MQYSSSNSSKLLLLERLKFYYFANLSNELPSCHESWKTLCLAI
jgi:hypothetical protein